MQTLEFEKGITIIDRPTLAKSASYELAKGALPPTRPLSHHLLLDQIVTQANAIPGIIVEEDPIYVTEAQAMRVMWAGKKEECPIENYLLQRLVTRIHLKSPEDQEMNMSIGVAYNEKGISMAFGPNIWVCQNQNVFGKNIMHTYGNERKMPFEKMMELLSKWFTDFKQMRAADYSFIERMKAKEITENSKQLLFGKLIEIAVKQNMDSNVTAPLNQTQVADFIRASYSPEYQVPNDRLATVWDLQQMGTSILKPKTADMVTMYEKNNMFNDFLVKEFQLS